jgi:hypothetical protein
MLQTAQLHLRQHPQNIGMRKVRRLTRAWIPLWRYGSATEQRRRQSVWSVYWIHRRVRSYSASSTSFSPKELATSSWTRGSLKLAMPGVLVPSRYCNGAPVMPEGR